VANTAPNAPSLFSACWDCGNRLYLDWSHGSDAQTSSGLTYNLRMGTAPGAANLINPMSAPDGFRRLAGPGNRYAARGAMLTNLPHTTYYWAVQTVDTAYIGSSFSAEMKVPLGLVIAVDDSASTGPVSPVVLNPLNNDTANPDNGELPRISFVSSAPHGSIEWTTGSSQVKYTPNAYFAGLEEVGYYARYNSGYCTRGKLLITVSGIRLSGHLVAENKSPGTYVGDFSTTSGSPGESFTYSLVSGDGSTNNNAFKISGSILQTNQTFDYEVKNSYTIRVRSLGSLSGAIERAFTIYVTDVGESSPTAITLSNNSVSEAAGINSLVGSFSTTDPDPNESFTYTLVSGTGSADNASFKISASELRTNAAFNYHNKNSYTIRVRSTDKTGLWVEQAFTILITDFNYGPSALQLNPTSLNEKQPAGTLVGTFTSTDPDPSDTHTYTLAAGPGSADNASFNITGSQLKSSAMFHYRLKSSYTIRVRATDQGGKWAEAEFTITILPLPEFLSYLPVVIR
jgi:hypothetical protein